MSDVKGLFVHSKNYFFATIANKALAFISIPIFTRLLTVEDYGVLNVFLSTVGIASIILTLNTETAISRYFFDATDEEDFKRFVGTSIKINLTIFAFLSILLLLTCQIFSEMMGFERLLVIALIPYSLYNYSNSVFTQIYNPMMQSKKIAVVSSIQAYLSFTLSVLIMLFMDEKKYYGVVMGTILTMGLLGGYFVSQIRKYYINNFDYGHLKYILNYSLPYLPYSLSGVILAQFGNLIIGQKQGFEFAGLYSFVSNISMLMMIVITITHSAWNPYYFRYMNSKDYNSITNDYIIIWRATLICAVSLSLFGEDLGAILGKQEFLKQLYLLPILVIGYCFYQWAYVFLRNTGYAKKMIWNSLVVIMSGILNIVLNAIFINKYGCDGVAVSFMISYFFMLILAWCVNKFIIDLYVPDQRTFIIPLFIAAPFFFYSYINPSYDYYFLSLIVKLLLILLLSIIYLYGYRYKIIKLFIVKK